MLLSISPDFADWPTGTSSNSPDLTPEALARFDVLLARGREQASKDCAAALPIFEQALEIDAGFAALHFDIADCARELGLSDRSRHHYRLASDLDRVPLGANTAYNEIIREVAESHGAIFVDAFALMEELSPDGLVGRQLCVDLVHPNLRAHQRIAEFIAERLRAEGQIEKSKSWFTNGFREKRAEAIFASNPDLVRREHLIRAFACILSLERSCALRSAVAVLEMTPDDPHAVELHRQALLLSER